MRTPRVEDREIPLNINDLNLRLRAFVDLPVRERTIEEEIRGLVTDIFRGKFTEEAAAQAFARILGRELDAFERAVMDALPSSRRHIAEMASDERAA